MSEQELVNTRVRVCHSSCQIREFQINKSDYDYIYKNRVILYFETTIPETFLICVGNPDNEITTVLQKGESVAQAVANAIQVYKDTLKRDRTIAVKAKRAVKSFKKLFRELADLI